MAQKRIQAKTEKRLQALEEMYQRYSQQPVSQSQPSVAPQSQPTDVWSDPDKYIDSRVDGKLQATLKQFETARDRKEAEQWILSQEFINPKTDYESLKDIAAEHGLDVLAHVDPWKAANTLVKLWKSEKGISDKSSEKPKAMSVQGAPAQANGKKVWSEREIKSMSLDTYEKYREDINAAFDEGRVKP